MSDNPHVDGERRAEEYERQVQPAASFLKVFAIIIWALVGLSALVAAVARWALGGGR